MAYSNASDIETMSMTAMAKNARAMNRWSRAFRAVGSIIVATCLSNAGVAAAAEPRLVVTGPEERVIAAETMNCSHKNGLGWDITDMPPNAFRRDDGTVILIAGNRANWYFEGPSLDKVKRVDCRSLLAPVDNPDPSEFRSHEWLVGMYSKDGKKVLGFIHNEFHGHEHGYEDCAISNRQNYECWYASSTMAKSEDGGRTFSRPPAPMNVLMTLPWRFTPGKLRAGVGLPKAVGNPADDKVYVFAHAASRDGSRQPGQCLVRGSGTSFDDWEMWDGNAFTPYDASPYGCKGTCVGHVGECVPVMRANVSSIKYIPSAGTFVALTVKRPHRVVYYLSTDLINWTGPNFLTELTLSNQRQSGEPAPSWYPSLLDPTSSSRNFDTLEGRPYLYFVRYRLDGDKIEPGRTDIMRIPLRIE